MNLQHRTPILIVLALASTPRPSPAAEPAKVAAADPTMLAASASPAAAPEVLHLMMGHSIVLTSPTPLKRLYVGNPAVLQTFTSGSTEVVLTAKALGLSSIILWETTGAHRLYSVSVELDPETLRASLKDAFPDASLSAETRDGRIYLAGALPTEAAVESAGKIATMYAKDVVNSIKVASVHPKQVELKLRIVEVDRTKLEQFGINIFGNGKNQFNTSTQQFTNGLTSTPATGGAPASLTYTDPLNLLFYNVANGIGGSVKDLEEKQILQVLAEPTLTTISGLPARFLSGGEFPFPVVQGGVGNSTAITITFRPYGVKVDFTPTVNPDGSIRLKVSPEVSALDFSNAVTVSGFTIPALSTRRADTEVEIKDGQSFVVSGLLDHRTTDSLSKVPGIASVPILGQLFRSKNFNHSTTELVVIVTAHVVNPLDTMPVVVEPKMATPNMESPGFDAETKGLLKSSAIKPAPTTPVTLTPQVTK